MRGQAARRAWSATGRVRAWGQVQPPVALAQMHRALVPLGEEAPVLAPVAGQDGHQGADGLKAGLQRLSARHGPSLLSCWPGRTARR